MPKSRQVRQRKNLGFVNKESFRSLPLPRSLNKVYSKLRNLSSLIFQLRNLHKRLVSLKTGIKKVKERFRLSSNGKEVPSLLKERCLTSLTWRGRHSERRF